MTAEVPLSQGMKKNMKMYLNMLHSDYLDSSVKRNWKITCQNFVM